MFEPILLKRAALPQSQSIEVYMANGGYQALEKALREYTPDELIEMMKKSKLRGRGGAGFPAGLKWSFMPKGNDIPKFLCVNTDEGEPGTFKDRELIEKDPHQVIEGTIIAAYAVGASRGYIYIRAEYPLAIKRLQIALAAARKAGLLGEDILETGFSFDIEVRMGAGAFVCGEETALIASIEGERGIARVRPPYPAVRGLFGMPTLINNVET